MDSFSAHPIPAQSGRREYLLSVSDTFKFEEECRKDGILIKVGLWMENSVSVLFQFHNNLGEKQVSLHWRSLWPLRFFHVSHRTEGIEPIRVPLSVSSNIEELQ